MHGRHLVTSFLVLFCSLLVPLLTYAETKILTSEASYIMGDGETPDSAEARVLQKAKQAALEEAGTYVQSYTKVQNLDLTTEEIQTVAGGVLQIEVLEKTRSLVADGLRFYTKIKATVTTEGMEELARRIKGKNVAEEYQKLQTEYARLNRELESWKQRAATIPQGQERKAALDQIREGEKAFAHVQRREADLFLRLVSGKKLVDQASRDKEIVDELIQTILISGYVVTVGDIQAVADSQSPDMLVLKVPLTIRLSEVVEKAVSHAANALGGSMQSDVERYLGDYMGPTERGYDKLRIQTETRNLATVTLVRIGEHPETAKYFQDEVSKLALLVTFLDGTNTPAYCLLGRMIESEALMSIGGRSRSDDDWFQLRRIFPISSTRQRNIEQFDYGGRKGWLREWLDYEPLKVKNTYYLIDNGRYETARGMDLSSASSGYVGIVRDEAAFIAQYRLPAQTMRNLTGVSVSAISLDKSYSKRMRAAYIYPYLYMCHTTLP